MQLAIIAAIFTAIVGVSFAAQNNVPVTVNFLLWRFDGSLAMVLLLALACGAIIVALLTTPATLKWQWSLARQKRRIEDLEHTCNAQHERIAELERNSPSRDPADLKPYVGLKQIILGGSEGEKATPSHS
jgi:putative membrane protein